MTDDSTRRLLLVEDEAPLRNMLLTHLGKSGFRVTPAEDAEAVLLSISRDEAPYDLVITDVHLPGLNGVELLQLLLSHSPLKPVLVITGDSDEALARTALKHGAAGYLLKPFELFELDAAVSQAITKLDLVEAAGFRARPDSAARDDARAYPIPFAWLTLADKRSTAGEGHGHRVERLARTLAGGLPDTTLTLPERNALSLAARAHEIGRLLGAGANEVELALRSAQLLEHLGVPADIRRVVSHMGERWDGRGPTGVSGHDVPRLSRILGAADRIDHGAYLRLERGVFPPTAILEAIEEVAEDSEAAVGPDVSRGVDEAKEVLSAIWILGRGGYDHPSEAVR